MYQVMAAIEQLWIKKIYLEEPMIIVHMGKSMFNRLIGLGEQFEQDSGLYGQIYDIGSGAI